MSRRAVDVLVRWVSDWVRPVPAAARRAEAQRLATEFLAYADDAGIKVHRLEEEIGTDLVGYMEEALADAAGDTSGDEG